MPDPVDESLSQAKSLLFSLGRKFEVASRCLRCHPDCSTLVEERGAKGVIGVGERNIPMARHAVERWLKDARALLSLHPAMLNATSEPDVLHFRPWIAAMPDLVKPFLSAWSVPSASSDEDLSAAFAAMRTSGAWEKLLADLKWYEETTRSLRCIRRIRQPNANGDHVDDEAEGAWLWRTHCARQIELEYRSLQIKHGLFSARRDDVPERINREFDAVRDKYDAARITPRYLAGAIANYKQMHLEIAIHSARSPRAGSDADMPKDLAHAVYVFYEEAAALDRHDAPDAPGKESVGPLEAHAALERLRKACLRWMANEVEPATPKAADVLPASAVADVCPVALDAGDGYPRILGEKAPKLDGDAEKIIRMMVEAYPLGCELGDFMTATIFDAPKTLKRVQKSHASWKAVIRFPGAKGKGGYRLAAPKKSSK